jgi:hypothetical protein
LRSKEVNFSRPSLDSSGRRDRRIFDENGPDTIYIVYHKGGVWGSERKTARLEVYCKGILAGAWFRSKLDSSKSLREEENK